MIDIIIPAYNAHNTINRCLASIATQTLLPEVKVTIVDDCSEKNYHAYTEFWAALMDIQEIRLEENGGPGVARQAGMDETEGDFIVFMDADDAFSGSYALEQLKKGIAGNDICVGQFIEETEDGFIPHRGDMVWVFSKMYRRRFIERHLVRFNETRANEDVGFNTVLLNLTDRIKYIPQTVYEWHFSPSTITRANNSAYTWAAGHRGYIENIQWAVEELRKRNINYELVRKVVVTTLCRLYWMHQDVEETAPWEASASVEKIKEFYRKAVKPIEEEGALPWVYIHETFCEVQKESMQDDRVSGRMQRRTFREFLEEVKS